MTQYNYQGFFVRNNLNEGPDGQPSGFGGCPDILLNGTTSAPNPNAFTTQQAYGDPGPSDVAMNSVNYVYVRAFNSTNGPLTGRAWLYYADGNVCLWPQKWYRSGIQVGASGPIYQDIVSSAAAGNEIVVTQQPFQWTPPTLPAGVDHYCAVTIIENPPVSTPPTDPTFAIGSLESWGQLVQFITHQKNLGWRNTRPVAGLGTTWQITEPMTGAPAGGQFYAGIACKNMPTDGYFSYSIPGEAGSGVNVPKSPITSPNMQNTVPLTWDANAQSSITISYWQGPTKPPFGALIAPWVIYPTSAMSMETLMHVQRYAPRAIRRLPVFQSTAMDFRTAIFAVVVGATPLTF